jgi:parvulin-like peptidyl-prolyl isomerase
MLTMLRKKMKVIMMTVIIIFAASMFYGLGYMGVQKMDTKDKNSIATIDGKEIDHNRFSQAVNKMFQSNKGRIKPDQAILYQTLALEQTIEFQIMLKEAQKKFNVSGREVDQTLDQIMQANKIPTRDALKNALANMGQDFDTFKKGLKEEILIAKMSNKIKGEVTLTPDDLREVKARHILIMPRALDDKSEFEARAKAEDILKRIKNGESFATFAEKYSDDTGSAKKGGELGYFTTGMMVPEFEKAAFSLKPGQISDVIRTSYGYHIIQVEDTRLIKVDTKGKDISAVILAQKQDNTFKRWLSEARQKAKIEINQPLLNAHAFLLTGRIKEAIAAYNKASIDEPSNAYVHLFLAQAYVKDGQKDLAMSEYDRATTMAGADPSLLIALGDDYRTLKNTQLALTQYRRASIIAGDNKALHIELKDIFGKLGSSVDVAKENSEIKRIEKKEKFEKEIQGMMKPGTN